MTRIDLTAKETDILTEVLESSLDELRTERVGTDNRELHAQLVERENVISGLIARLAQGKSQE